MVTVEQALASGMWKEKVQPGTGRKYYVNPHTKKSVWNLEKELKRLEAEGGGGGGGNAKAAAEAARAPSPKSMREERHEKVRRRAEAEAQLKATITSLESQKVELESEIARLQGPVEAESMALMSLRQELQDAGFSLQAVEQEVMEQRRKRTAELRDVQSRVASLQSVAENERKHREAVEQRHEQLVAESLDLKADLHREQVTADSLRASVRAAELKLEEANAELARQRAEIKGKEEQVATAERDLVMVSKRKADVLKEVDRLKKEVADVRREVERSGRVHPGAKNHSKSNSMDLLQNLTQKYETKKKTLNNLLRLEQEEGDVSAFHHCNMRLRTLIDDAGRDKEALERLLRILNHETRHAGQVVKQYRTKLASLQQHGNNLPAPKDWPFTPDSAN